MGSKVIEENDYSLLKDFKLEIDGEDGTFSLSFWLYLMNTTQFPATIISQVHSDIASSVPLLAFDERRKMMLLPLLLLHKEAPGPADSTSWKKVPFASADIEFPLETWVHVGCEVFTNGVRLYINGKTVGEIALSSSLSDDTNSNGLKGITLVGTDGTYDALLGYVHNPKLFPLISSMKEHYVKNPPLQLSVDSSSALDIEEDSDGIWCIVGGKASCRRNFSLDVILSNAFGQPVNKDLEVIAALLYDDNGAPVEKPNDAEAPLLTSYDGIEFASCDRPSKLLHGHAPFKLKISQLSSKCDNRLFRIRFDIPKFGTYPFFKAFSLPIRCISRNRNTRASSLMLRNPSSSIHPLTGSDEGFIDLQHNTNSEAKHTPPTKRMKLGYDKSLLTSKANLPLDQPDEEYYSQARTNTQFENAFGTSRERKPENYEDIDDSPSDSESIEERDSMLKSMPSSRNQISDSTVFKYCLGGVDERALLLKELGTSLFDQQLADFAQQVSLYSGCSHHRNQIIIAKKLIAEGTKAWDIISQNNDHVQWKNAIFDIEDQFMKIVRCNSRSLSQQDFEILRRVAGCREYLARENFEKMWCWLYPIAVTLSRDRINTMWGSTSPKWIEGFITKEEAEFSLQGPRGLQEPGTFILRFPTSRSWPHPDAGSLIITYVGSDYSLHHKPLSIDYIHSSGVKETNVKPLQDMLLAEPELSRLGRILRSY